MALNYFKDQQVDVAIVETGLGGRLDSTNIVFPELVVITPIHFDHEKQLGNTLGEIAGEKAGIIKSETIVISAEQEYEALDVIKKKSVISDTLHYLPDYLQVSLDANTLDGMEFTIQDNFFNQTHKQLRCRQLGTYQINNIALAYFASRIYMNKNNLTFNLNQFKKALKENLWPGRIQLINRNPNIILDVSHNFIGIQKTLHYLSGIIEPKALHILIALVQDKNYFAIAETISQYSRDITITEADTHRKLDGELLADALKKSKSRINLIKDLIEAYDFRKKQLHERDTLLVIGSHYLIGSLLKSKII
jgi:dihydrofolate synthase/folylpolyglutamate synthase